MCGIAGIVASSDAPPPSRLLLHEMARYLAHRGPDDEGFHVEHGIGLVHRRLSIVDLSGGRQPLYSEDGRVVAVVNGEIYNHADLRNELSARGHIFKTCSDSEVVVHAYEEWGESCVENLRGMFAFAVWDRYSRELLLARDRLGIKPLYWTRLEALPCSGDDRPRGEGLVFGSEIKAILADPSVDRSIDFDALDTYLALRYVPGPSTILRSVRKLLPGQKLVYRDGRIELSTYWDIPLDWSVDESPSKAANSPQTATHLSALEAEAVAGLQNLLDECVTMRLMADVPVGVFLSGGLDSSAVAAVMSRRAGERPVRSFSIGYPAAPKEDELQYARLVARYIGTKHREVILKPEDTRDLLPLIAWHMDEPVADPAAIPLFVLARAARQDVTVVLSGEGADEIFAGYSIYGRSLKVDALRRKLGGAVLSLVGAVGRKFVTSPRVYRHLERLGLPLEDSYRGVSSAFTDLERRSLTHGHVDVAKLLRSNFDRVEGMPPLTKMLYLDSKVWLPDDLLVKADKMTMAHALELRVPFLDHMVVEFASRLPEIFKLRAGAGKYLLRKAVEGMVPESIIRRKKKGFPVPVATWLKREDMLGDYARDKLLAASSICRDLFPVHRLDALVSEHISGKKDRTSELWTLLFLEVWHESVVRKAPRRGTTAVSRGSSGYEARDISEREDEVDVDG